MSLTSTTSSVSDKNEFTSGYVWSFKDKAFAEHFTSEKAFTTIQSPLFGPARDDAAKFYLSLTYISYYGSGKPASSHDSMVFFNVSPLERRKMHFKADISVEYRDKDGYSHTKKLNGNLAIWQWAGGLIGSVDHDWICWKLLTESVERCKYVDEITCLVRYSFDENANLTIPCENFSTLYRNTSTTDVALYISKHNNWCTTKFSAHKHVLSAQSPFFRNIFSPPSVARYDFDVDCSLEVVEALLEFVYTQQIKDFSVLKVNAEKLMQFAQKFEMPSLTNYVEDQFAVNLVVESAITSLSFALSKKLPLLKKFALLFIYSNLQLVIQSTAWAEHVRNDFTLIDTLLDNLDGYSVQFYSFMKTYPQEWVPFEEAYFEELRSFDGLVDAKLRVNGSDFPVYKAMLTEQSSKFAKLFENVSQQQNSSQNSPQNTTIEITGYSESAIKTMLDFIYFQPIPFTSLEQVSDELLNFAQKYRMPSLRRFIIEQCYLHRSSTNCLRVLRFARRNKLVHLDEHMVFFVWARMRDIRKTDEWKQEVIEKKDFDLIEHLLSIFPTVVQCKCHNPDAPGGLKKLNTLNGK